MSIDSNEHSPPKKQKNNPEVKANNKQAMISEKDCSGSSKAKRNTKEFKSKIQIVFERPEKNQKLSDKTEDFVRSVCQICWNQIKISQMRSHVRYNHDVTIKEYRERFGDPEDDFVEMVYHQCKLCQKVILHCGDALLFNVRCKHKMTYANYVGNIMEKIIRGKNIKEDIATEKNQTDKKIKNTSRVSQNKVNKREIQNFNKVSSKISQNLMKSKMPKPTQKANPVFLMNEIVTAMDWTFKIPKVKI